MMQSQPKTQGGAGRRSIIASYLNEIALAGITDTGWIKVSDQDFYNIRTYYFKVYDIAGGQVLISATSVSDEVIDAAPNDDAVPSVNWPNGSTTGGGNNFAEGFQTNDMTAYRIITTGAGFSALAVITSG